MPLSVKPKHLKRYRDIVRLFVKYGRSDLVESAGVDDLPPDEALSSGDGRELGAKADQLAKDLEALGPTFIKAGQFLSTRADLLPTVYLEALDRLQDKVAPFPFVEVEHIVAEELGTRLSKAFAVFDDIPLAAASLGQVHRAELRDGRLVAVKVQRPGIRERIVEDLEALAQIASFLDHHTQVGKRFGFVTMLEEFRKSLLRELDYRQEARHLVVLAENLGEFERIVVPRPIDDYVTSHVLTMDLVSGRKVTAIGPLARMDIDGAALAEDLCRAYLQQMLVDGFFHADPHPGNVFLTDDGRLALLDLGMVSRLTPRLQEKLLKLLLAVSEGRGEDAAEVVLELSAEAPPGPNDVASPARRSLDQIAAHERVVRRRVAELVARFQDVQIGDIQVGRVMLEITRIAADGDIHLPQELTLLSKALLNIDRVTRTLDPNFDPNASVRRNAAEIMRLRMRKSLSPGKLFAGMLELKEFAEKLPGRLNALIDAAVENKLRIKVEAIDEVLLMEGFQKIANRITFGLVVAGLIVGAAMLMRIETSFRLFGYPGLAIVFFLAAALCGLAMVVNIVVNDLRARK